MERSLRKIAFNRNIKHMLQKIGLYSSINSLYWKVVRSLSGSNVRGKIGGVDANFITYNYSDYRSLHHKLESERIVITDILREIKPKDVFYDIGANNGMFSIFAKRSEVDATVFAFEPSPQNKEIMQKNLEINAVDARIFGLALSDNSSMVNYIACKTDNSAKNGWIAQNNEKSENAISVESQPGDKLIQKENLPEPNIIKIDVEGAEKKVLEGLKDSISNSNCRLIHVEVHTPKLSEEEISSIYELLHSAGFETEIICNRANKAVKASK